MADDAQLKYKYVNGLVCGCHVKPCNDIPQSSRHTIACGGGWELVMIFFPPNAG